jgi:Holliday junction resolvase RusA-like endonuclease
VKPAISFFVSGEPKGQPRPRAFAMKLGNGKYSARVFDAGTAENWKSAIAAVAVNHTPSEPFPGAVAVRISFHFARPRSHYRTGKHAGVLRENALLLHTGKPDCDNLAKAVLDCLTQLGGFWRDDSQVAYLRIWKSYGPQGAHIEITEAQ